MKVTLEIDDILQVLSRTLGRELSSENIRVEPEGLRVEILDLDITDLMKVNEAITPKTYKAVRSVGARAEEGPVSAADMAELAHQSRELERNGGGAGPVPEEEIPEEFLPAGATYDDPPPTG